MARAPSKLLFLSIFGLHYKHRSLISSITYHVFQQCRWVSTADDSVSKKVLELSLLSTLPSFAQAVADASNKDDYDSAIKALTDAHGTIGILLLMAHYDDLEAARAAKDPVKDYALSELDPTRPRFDTLLRTHRGNYRTLLTRIKNECASKFVKASWKKAWNDHVKDLSLDDADLRKMLKAVSDGLSIPNDMEDETVQEIIADSLRLDEAATANMSTFSGATMDKMNTFSGHSKGNGVSSV